MERQVNRYLYWAPRALAILFILFLAMFSLDVISPGLSTQRILIGLFMHNLPSLVLLVVLIIAWRYEIVGGIFFILAGLLYVIWMAWTLPWFDIIGACLAIGGPAILVGVLFMLNWNKKKQQSS